MKRKILAPLLVLLALAALYAPGLVAQTTVNSTTTTAALTATQQIIPLTSVSTMLATDQFWIDGESMVLTDTPDTVALTAKVRRGANGTGARPHVSGAVVWSGPARRFSSNEAKGGACTASAEEFLPRLVVPSGNAYDCKNGEWMILRLNGFRMTPYQGRSDGGTTYTALGAITVQSGISFINGTTLAMTLIDPTTDQNGMIMSIISTNASAHTVTYTAGFGGGTTARDVATFGGAVNDNMVIVAFNKVWWVISSRNVTFG